MPGLSEEEKRELREYAKQWAAETTAAQGLPLKVMDLDVLRSVCELLGMREPARDTQTRQ